MTEVPRRLLVLGGGPVGVEMAQAVRADGRLGRAGRGHGAPARRASPQPLGEALGEALAADGVELHFGQPRRGARRDGDEYVLEFPDGDELRGDRLLVATGRRPRIEGIGLETIGIEPGERRHRGRRAHAAGDGVWAIGDVTGIWPLTYVGKYQGRIAAANILGRAARGQLRRGAARGVHRPAGGAVGEADGPITATVPLVGGAAHRDVHARLRGAPGS